MSEERPTYTEWLGDRTGSGDDRPLTAAEQAAFDRWYREDAPEARRVARRIVGAEAAEDAVHGAIVRAMHGIVKRGKSLPPDYGVFRRRMLATVQSLAINMKAGVRYTPPAHSCWSQAQAPLSCRNVPERLLATDFVSYTEEPAEAADTGVTYPLLPSSAYRGPWGPQPDPVAMAQELAFILDQAILELPDMQWSVLVLWLDDPSRGGTSVVLEISPKTYDTHFARAKPNLRKILLSRQWMVPDIPGHPERGWHVSAWTEVFRDMELDRLDRTRAARIGRSDTAAPEKKKAA